MTPRDIAENLLGAIDWQGDGTGYCTCPGARFHTKGNSKRDCRVYVDDGVPTITCFHSSCSAEVETANHTLRSTIAKAEMKRDEGPARSPDSPMRVKSIHSYRQSRKPWETKTERDDINAKPATYNVENPDAIPAPMKDGTRELLRAAFEENEGVQICQARLNEEGHEVPDGFGVVLSRKEWLKQLDDCDGDTFWKLLRGDFEVKAKRAEEFEG